jgi:predicted dienelactone hydrolase
LYNTFPLRRIFALFPIPGHFDFLPPCTPEFAKRTAKDEPELCSDTTGFDRAAFHKQFNADILTFFRKYLIEANQ